MPPTTAWILAATVLGAALRCVGLWSHPLDFDETATLYFAGLPWGDLVGAPARLEPNPPLFYAAAHMARLMLGTGEAALRAVPVLAGVACVPVAAGIARQIGGPAAAVAAAFLVATSTSHVLTSQYARAYALLTLAALVAIWAAVRVLAAATRRQPGGAGTWAVFAASCIAALYSHNTAVLMVASVDAVILAVWWSAGRPGPFARRWAAANLVIAVLYAPWIPIVLQQSTTTLASFWLARPGLNELRWEALGTYAQPYVPWLQPGPDLLFLGLAALGVAAHRRSPVVVAIAAFVVVGVPLATFGLSQWRPLMNGKTLLWLVPVGLVLAALGCARLREAAMAAAAILVAVQLAATSAYLAARTTDEEFPKLTAALRADARPGDAIYLSSPSLELALDYYAWPAERLRPFARPPTLLWYRHARSQLMPPADAPQMSGTGRLWVLTRSAPAVQSEVERALAGRASLLSSQRFGRGRSQTLELRLWGP